MTPLPAPRRKCVDRLIDVIGRRDTAHILQASLDCRLHVIIVLLILQQIGAISVDCWPCWLMTTFSETELDRFEEISESQKPSRPANDLLIKAMEITSSSARKPISISQATHHLFHLYYHQRSARSRSDKSSSRDACMSVAYQPQQRASRLSKPRLSNIDSAAIAGATTLLLLGSRVRNVGALRERDYTFPLRPSFHQFGRQHPEHANPAERDKDVLKLRTVSFLHVRVNTLGTYAQESVPRALSAMKNVQQKLSTASSTPDELIDDKVIEKGISSPHIFALSPKTLKASQQVLAGTRRTFSKQGAQQQVADADKDKGETLGKLDSNAQGVCFISAQLVHAHFSVAAAI
ncbi:hypothetical protein E3P99_03022 [Wallemia hederae]|uniref:Uncharacterized protein n=1 Tax=Wallemia hederae TaxID=1540922 RepID=A0A4T0FH27_9BASI|nr:hypothetical protein E3P99_03022 [Wallemia hederae]